MEQRINLSDPAKIAADIIAEMQALPVNNAKNARVVCRKYSRMLKQASPEFVLELARELLNRYNRRWLSYELIQNHEAAFQILGEAELEEFGQGINSWGSVDCFGRILSGPLWLRGQIKDELIHKWACSEDRWWRRAALVSTVT